MTAHVIYSAIQPTGRLHLGNYLGAVRQWLNLQSLAQAQLIFGLADLHALTSPKSPSNKIDNIAMMTELLACGLDHEKCILKRQSRVLYHTQLGWILTCLAPLGKLKLMTQYKSKSIHHATSEAGLLIYPVLQAADILLYKTTLVPVGEDQFQHLELCRDLAQKFNVTYGSPYFPLPSSLAVTQGMDPLFGRRIMSLVDGKKKMSKSDPHDAGRINLLDGPDIIRQKLKNALTDSYNYLSFDPTQRPHVSNLLSIYAALSHLSISDILAKYPEPSTKSASVFASFKSDLADLIISLTEPIQERWHALHAQPHVVTDILEKGEQQASAIASQHYSEILNLVGLSSSVSQS